MSVLAESQHGVVARRQLLEIGLSARAVDRRVHRGTLHRIHRGVYAVGHRRLTRSGRWNAAVLACGPAALLSHRTAAVAWGLIPPTGRRIEVSRPTGWCGPGDVILHRTEVPDDEREVVDGIPVTSMSRTILDLAAVVSRRQLERAVNEMEVRRLTARRSLPDLLERYPRRGGTAVLRGLLGDRKSLIGVTENELEERFLMLLDAAGLPRPRVNAELFIRGGFIRPDFAWPQAGLVVETDGGAAHRTDEAFQGDRARDRVLIAEGWRVIRVTWLHLRDAPHEVLDDVRRALRRGGALIA